MYFHVYTATFFVVHFMVDYALFGNRQKARGLEIAEYICLPVMVFLLKLFLLNEGYIAAKIICVVLLVAQSVMVCIKVIYFGPVTDELAQYII